LKQAAKTVLAVVIGLEAFRYFEGQVALYAGMSAGFLMQSTAGRARRTRQIAMGAMGLITTIFVGLGSELSARHWAKQVLLVMAAFTAFYVRRFIPGKAMFPIFGFTLTLLATVQPGGARSAGPMMAAVLTGLCSAFLVYFFVLPEESLRAFRHAAQLFLFRLRHAQENPGAAEDDLRAMHRAVALEEEEREHLGELASEHCGTVLGSQYEALQVLVLLNDIGHQQSANGDQEKAARFSRDYLAQVTESLETQSDLLNA